MENPMSFMAMFQIAICVYLLYCAVTKKGQVYKDDMIHPSKRDEYKKLITLFCYTMGPVGIIGGICDFKMWFTASWIFYGIFFAGIVYLVVKSWGMGIDRLKSKEQAAKSPTKPAKTKLKK